MNIRLSQIQNNKRSKVEPPLLSFLQFSYIFSATTTKSVNQVKPHKETKSNHQKTTNSIKFHISPLKTTVTHIKKKQHTNQTQQRKNPTNDKARTSHKKEKNTTYQQSIQPENPKNSRKSKDG